MKNCIFLCIFNNENYINLLYLLLESLYIYGNLKDDTEILVYTSMSYMEIIKKSHLYNSKIIKFEINDNYNNMDKACKSRLDLFNLASIVKYNKILYLDTDIIIKDDINKVFDVVNKDILYTVEEGEIDGDFWGKEFFNEEINNYEDKSAFTSGILLFNNCEKIKTLFEKINEHIATAEHDFHDQPYIVYNAFKYNLYNNKILKQFATNNDHDLYNDKVIYHFAGEVGNHIKKIDKMAAFLNNKKDETINANIEKTKDYINTHLLDIIKDCNELLEGNIFMFHHTTEYTDAFLNKTKNICNLLLNRNIKNVMEIGFNSGFSTLLMLITNPDVNITCVDIGEHKYTLPCYEMLKNTFGNRIQLLIGDSTKVLQHINYDSFDLIHIDGGHSTEVAESDIIQSYRLSTNKTILIMDDYDFSNLHELWDKFVNYYNLKPLNINIYDSPHHDIKYVIKK